MRRACAALILLVFITTCFSVYAEGNESQSIHLFIYGDLQDPDGMNSYLEQVRCKSFPDLNSVEIVPIASDEFGIQQLTVYIIVYENGVCILPRNAFAGFSSSGILLPLEEDEELMASVGENGSIERGWRRVGDEIHLYGIPMEALPGMNQYLYAEDGLLCAFAGDAGREDAKALLRILCRDFAEQAE